MVLTFTCLLQSAITTSAESGDETLKQAEQPKTEKETGGGGG